VPKIGRKLGGGGSSSHTLSLAPVYFFLATHEEVQRKIKALDQRHSVTGSDMT
jgi:hypothetical protein